MLSVQHYSFAEAVSFLAPRVGRATVLAFNNLLVEPAAAIDALPAGQVAWGFPGAGGGFGDDGVLRAALLPVVFFGTLGGPPSERGRAVRTVFREAGFRLRETTDFRGWLTIHFLQNAGLHSQSLRLGSLAELAGGRHDVREAILATRELLPLAEARGVDLPRHPGRSPPPRRVSAAAGGSRALFHCREAWVIARLVVAVRPLPATAIHHPDPCRGVRKPRG